MAKRSPQAVCREKLTEQGYLVEVVEQFIRTGKGGFRRDLLGFIDLLCFKDGEVLGVQVTSADNVSARVKKIADSDRVHHARNAGWRLEVHGMRADQTFRIVDVS